MEYVALVLAIIAGVACTIAAATSAALSSANQKIASLKTEILKIQEESQVKSATSEAEVLKREELISTLKKNISDLEKSLAETSTTADVRRRLSQLLSDP